MRKRERGEDKKRQRRVRKVRDVLNDSLRLVDDGVGGVGGLLLEHDC